MAAVAADAVGSSASVSSNTAGPAVAVASNSNATSTSSSQKASIEAAMMAKALASLTAGAGVGAGMGSNSQSQSQGINSSGGGGGINKPAILSAILRTAAPPGKTNVTQKENKKAPAPKQKNKLLLPQNHITTISFEYICSFPSLTPTFWQCNT